MLGNALLSAGTFPLVVATTVIPPLAILVLCVVAGIGTLLLLPGRREQSMRAMGGAVLGLGLAIMVALVIHGTAGMPKQGIAIGVYFWIFSIIAIVGAIRVVTHPRPVYSALYFVLTVFASAGLFVLLAAEFMAVALVLIYAGAILVTYVFVIMLASQATAADGTRGLAGLADYDVTSREPFVATCVGFAMMGVLMFVIFDKAQDLIQPQPLMDSVAGQVVPPEFTRNQPTQALGEYLFRHQLVNLELAGLILTLSMVGAILIARRRVETNAAGMDVEPEEVLGPATPINDNPHSIPVVGTRNPAQKAFPET